MTKMIHQKTYDVSTKKEGRYTLVVIKASMYWHFEIVMSIYRAERGMGAWTARWLERRARDRHI